MRLLISLGDCSKYSDFICKPSTPKTFASNMKRKPTHVTCPDRCDEVHLKLLFSRVPLFADDFPAVLSMTNLACGVLGV